MSTSIGNLGNSQAVYHQTASTLAPTGYRYEYIEQPQSHMWRISKLIQALAYTIFSFGFALFSDYIRHLWKQVFSGKEIVQTLVKENTVPLTQLEQTLKNPSHALPYRQKEAEKQFKLAIQLQDLIDETNCHLFQHAKHLDFSGANYPLNRELIDELIENCTNLKSVTINWTSDDLDQLPEENFVEFPDELTRIDTIRYWISQNRDLKNHQLSLKISNITANLIAFLSVNETKDLYKSLVQQSGILTKGDSPSIIILKEICNEIQRNGTVALISKKLFERLEAIFKSMPPEELIRFLSLTRHGDLEDKLEIIAPLALQGVGRETIEVFLEGLDASSIGFLSNILIAVGKKSSISLADDKVRVIIGKIIRLKPSQTILWQLYQQTYLRPILLSLLNRDQFQDLCTQFKRINSSLERLNLVKEACLFLDAISKPTFRDRYENVKHFLNLFKDAENNEFFSLTMLEIIKEVQQNKVNHAQIHLDISLVSFIAYLNKRSAEGSVITLDKIFIEDWELFAKHLGLLGTIGEYEEGDVDLYSTIMESFISVSKSDLILKWLEPILRENPANKVVADIFTAFWDQETLILHEGGLRKDYFQKIFAIISAEQLEFLVSTAPDAHKAAIKDLITENKDSLIEKMPNVESFVNRLKSPPRSRTLKSRSNVLSHGSGGALRFDE